MEELKLKRLLAHMIVVFGILLVFIAENLIGTPIGNPFYGILGLIIICFGVSYLLIAQSSYPNGPKTVPKKLPEGVKPK